MRNFRLLLCSKRIKKKGIEVNKKDFRISLGVAVAILIFVFRYSIEIPAPLPAKCPAG